MTPNVVCMLKYYDMNSPRRAFYSSSDKDDYIGYIDKGIKSNKEIDYIDYAGDTLKSSGVFNQNGLLTKDEIKELRQRLRQHKGCIWDLVLSFEGEYGIKNCDDMNQAITMLNKVLPKFFKDAGFNYSNITWYAGLHTNTDNRHIHLSFFENEPQIYNRKNKEYRFHRGRLNLSASENMKAGIEAHFMSPVESIKRNRKILIDDARLSVESLKNNKNMKYVIKALYNNIPYKGSLDYNSLNMLCVRDYVDSVINYVLECGTHNKLYEEIKNECYQRDITLKEELKNYRIDNPDSYMLLPKIEYDLKARMGNALIKEIVKARKDNDDKVKEIKHPKAQSNFKAESLIQLLSKTASLIKKCEDEEYRAFLEYENRMRKAEIDRLIEEGYIDPDTLKGEVVM